MSTIGQVHFGLSSQRVAVGWFVTGGEQLLVQGPEDVHDGAAMHTYSWNKPFRCLVRNKNFLTRGDACRWRCHNATKPDTVQLHSTVEVERHCTCKTPIDFEHTYRLRIQESRQWFA
jgi:hypothetical protein